MKRTLQHQKGVFTLLLALCLGMGTAYAYSFSKTCSTGQTLYYNIINFTQHYVEITYPANNNADPWGGYTKPSGNITLPSSVTYNGVTYYVKRIGDHAFDQCYNLSGSLTIPSSVTSIGDGAFNYCEGFSGTLTIGTNVSTIGEQAFSQCSGFSGNLTIPSSVNTIGWAAFSQCSGFTGNLTIGNSVNSIDDYAFEGCSGFSGTLTIGTNVSTIGRGAFSGCNSLTQVNFNATNCADVEEEDYPFEDCTGSLVIGNNVTRIPSYMFIESDFDGTLTIGSSVTSIGNSAFYQCSFTGPLVIPNSVITIGGFAFFECLHFSSLTLGDHVTTIYSCAFRYCAMAYTGFSGNLIIPNSVTTIGTAAFEECYNFAGGTLTIGTGVTSIGQWAFRRCGFSQVNYNATSCADFDEGDIPFEHYTGTITIGSNVQRVPAHLTKGAIFSHVNFNAFNCVDVTTTAKPFEGCSGTLTIGNSVQRIPAYMFYECTNFTGSLNIPNSVTEIGDFAFYTTGFNGSLTLGSSLTTIGQSAFFGCVNFTGSLTIPNSVTTMGDAAFAFCMNFTGLTLGSSLTSISDVVFTLCTGFTGSLTIPNSVTSIGVGAFNSCTGFTGSLTIGNNVTAIGEQAFQNCGFTGALTIGSDVTSIALDAFSYCTGFTSITALPETPPTLGEDAFEDVPTTIPVYVPCPSLEDYQSASGWSNFTNMQCFEALSVFDGTATNGYVPVYGYYADAYLKAEFVMPSTELVEMVGCDIINMKFYATSPASDRWTSTFRVFMKEVNDASINAFSGTGGATVVYEGLLDGTGSEMTIHFNTPYHYNGGNLLVGVYNITKGNYKSVTWAGVTATDASVQGYDYNSLEAIEPTQRNFIPKTTFGYTPICEPRSLPYSYGFENSSEFDCWTRLDCHSSSGINLYAAHEGNYGFQFWYNTNPPQYLISPKFEGATGMNVSFYYKNYMNIYPETFQVGYSTTTKSPSAFTWGAEVTANDETTWMLYEDYFPEGTKYVAVKLNSYDQYRLYLDDFSFTPAFCPPEDRCELTFTLTDSYGDTWNGNAIRVVDVETGTILATMTNHINDHPNAPITETFTLAVCDGRELRFEWVMGNYPSFPTECFYTIADANGITILEGQGNEDMNTGDVLGTYTVDCSLQYVFLTDGNWNDGSHWNTGSVPPAGSNVIIQADVTVPAGYLAVANAVTLDGGSITVADGGQLKHNTQGLEVTMKKNIVGYDDANDIRNYYLLSFPFVHIDVPAAMSATGSDFYRFDLNEPNAEWRNLRSETFNIQIVHGYLFASPESNVLSLTGHTYPTTTETMWDHVVEYTEGSANPYNGWELLGNPLTYNVYIYRQTSDGELVPMPIMMYDEEGELQTIYGGPVAPMQGFFVHVTETTTVYFSGTALHEDDYVDLGLPSGLLWATCNVGAEAPEDYGDYFAWDETQPKDTYNWSTYQYCNGSKNTLTKYCNNSSYGYNGFTDDLTTLLPEDDAATANWGSNWRMPTKEEWQELYNNTTHTWTTQNGVNGRLFTAANGNSLFLPAAGYRSNSDLFYAGSYGFYWSSSLYTGYPYYAWGFGFGSDNYEMGNSGRYSGQSVRPVRSPQTEHAYVDLGLPSGTKWATCNVGADSPEDYGDYFAWGETTPKDTYDWDTYQYGDGDTFTKYTGSDGLTTLLPEDDAATANWGPDWRMPTKEEWQELLDNTTVTWTTQNGVSGRLFTAANGNSLFLPAAGGRWDDELDDVGDYGNYWSSSLDTGHPYDAWIFGFYMDYFFDMASQVRFIGYTVRPVREN